jgi:hypothetical protein
MNDSRPAADPSRLSIAAILLALPASLLLLPGCLNTRSSTAVGLVADEPPKGPDIPAPGETRRVGGDMETQVTKDGDNYRVAKHLINTPLPVGYPAPTPPGAIELKMYPTVRRAEVSGKRMPDLSMNVAFFPLFNHIKRRNIEMTSPVEMDYRDIKADPKPQAESASPTAATPGTDKPGTATPDKAETASAQAATPESTPTTPDDAERGWTMSFLYRNAELGPTGDDSKDARVTVVDTPPMLVISVGFAGNYAKWRVQQAVDELEAWLEDHAEWEPAGPARALFYNGPDTSTKLQWAEAQIPVVPRTR